MKKAAMEQLQAVMSHLMMHSGHYCCAAHRISCEKDKSRQGF